MGRRPVISAVIAVVALSAAVLIDASPVDAAGTFSITVQPSAPTTHDAVDIIVQIELDESPCGVSSAHVVSDGTVAIFIQPEAEYCAQVIGPTSFSLTEQVGPLPPGTYQVVVISSFDLEGEHETFAVSGGPAVGGIAELPEVERAVLGTGSSQVGGGALAGVVAAVAAGVLTLSGAAWYARRRLSTGG